MTNNLVKIRRFNENVSPGLQELLDTLKSDRELKEFLIMGDNIGDFWRVSIIYPNISEIFDPKISIDESLEKQEMISRKTIEIAKHYDIFESKSSICKKGSGYILSIFITLK